MTLNSQQKNIVNPFAQESTSYVFSDRRNRFVLDVIHDSYINFHTFLTEGQQLLLSMEELQALQIEKETPNLNVSAADLAAYTILYRQNSIIVEMEGDRIKLEVPSGEISQEKLSSLVSQLEQRGVIDLYTSNSTPSSLLPENVNNLGPAGLVSRLIAIPPNHSNEYLTLMRKSVNLQNEIPLESFESIENFSMSPVATSFVNSDNNVDIYDWRENCGPGTDTNKIYYNTVDDKFYYTTRTDITATQLFDMSYWAQSQEAAQEMLKAVRTGLSEILKFTGKYSPENLQKLLDYGLASDNVNFVSHLGVRPGSRWIHAIRVKRGDIDNLEPGASGAVISYDEFELTPLEKAQILVDSQKNKATNKKFMNVGNLIRYIPNVVFALREYAYQLKDENISPEDIQGIDLSREATRIDSFIDMLSLAYIYNKVTLDDNDVIEFGFTDQYELEYFVVNGFLMTRGIGNKTFYKTPEDEEAPKKILDAFSLLSPTAYSAISNSYGIYSDYSLRAEDSKKPWTVFFDDYLYPPVSLSPEKIREKAENSLLQWRRSRRQKLYTKIVNLNKEGKEIEDNFRRKNKSRNPYYQVATILGTTIVAGQRDCNTAQSEVLRNVLQFWQNVTGKTKIRSLVRQAIMLTRDELIQDSVTKAYLSGALAAGDNPRLFIREIEQKINQEIFCGLDVMGNVIETQFLDAKNMSPEKTAGGKPPGLGAPLKIDLNVPKGIQGFTKSKHQRQTELYEKMVKEIILGFIKSIALGIIKDVVKAVLGCGPDGPNEDTLNDVLKDLRFGFLDLNEYLGDIDVVEIAKKADMYNIRGEEKIDPTLEQITTFIRDVSYMCTPSELDRLTYGDGDNILYELILETIEDGVITFPVERNANPNEEIERRTINPEIYGSIEFSVDKIQNFFIFLGDSMRDENAEELAKFTFSPLEAYCADRDPSLDTLGLEISQEQLEAQYFSLAEDKIAKINAMCDLLRGLENIQRQLEDLINSIPIMEGYNDLLQSIADFSNALWQAFADWWANLFEEPLKEAQSPQFNLYVTSFGQDLFYSIRMLISRRIMVAQQRTVDKYEEFSYYAPTWNRRTGYKRSRVDLPYPPPDKLTDPWFSDPVIADTDDNEASYAMRTSPLPLREQLYAVRNMRSNWNEALDDYYTRLHNQLRSYWTRQKLAYTPDQWIANFPEYASCTMYVNNLNDGGVRIFRRVKTRKTTFVTPGEDPFVIESKLLAMYIPKEGDSEPDQSGVDYYRLLSGIGDKHVGGENTGGPLIHGEFAVDEEPILPSARTSLMPSRNNPKVTELINDTMQGLISWEVTDSIIGNHEKAPVPSGTGHDLAVTEDEPVAPWIQEESDQGGVIDTWSVANWSEFIDEQINDSYIQTYNKAKLRPYLKATNIPPFVVNDDKCVTNEEAQIAQSVILSIQSRIQPFFMNVLPLARVYPHWNSIGTARLVTDYLSRKIYEDLNKKELVNLMYDKLPIVQKVFSDVPENDLDLSDSQTPKQFIATLVEKIYGAMLRNISSKVYTSISSSPYSPSITKDRYRAMLIKFFTELSTALLAEGNEEDQLGLTGRQYRNAILFIDNVLLIDFNGEKLLTPKGYLYGTYYFPMSFFIGLYLITYDSLVNISRNFESGYFKTLVEIAGADDSLLSNLTGQSITKYQQQLEIFPVKEVTWDRVEMTYYTREQVLDRIAALTALEENEPQAILLREYPDFFRRYGSRDLPEQMIESLGEVLLFMWTENVPLTIETLRERLALHTTLNGEPIHPRPGERVYPYYAAFMLLEEIESRNLRTLEDVFGDLENLVAMWRTDPGLQIMHELKKQIPVEKNKLEALLRT